MSTIGKRRRENLRRLIDEEYDGVVQRLAAQVEMPHSQVWRVLREKKGENAREMGERLARRIEAACGKSEGWLDLEPTDQTSQESELLAQRILALGEADRDAVLRMVKALSPDADADE